MHSLSYFILLQLSVVIGTRPVWPHWTEITLIISTHPLIPSQGLLTHNSLSVPFCEDHEALPPDFPRWIPPATGSYWSATSKKGSSFLHRSTDQSMSEKPAISINIRYTPASEPRSAPVGQKGCHNWLDGTVDTSTASGEALEDLKQLDDWNTSP